MPFHRDNALESGGRVMGEWLLVTSLPEFLDFKLLGKTILVANNNGPPVVPFSPVVWGRVPQLKHSTDLEQAPVECNVLVLRLLGCAWLCGCEIRESRTSVQKRMSRGFAKPTTDWKPGGNVHGFVDLNPQASLTEGKINQPHLGDCPLPSWNFRWVQVETPESGLLPPELCLVMSLLHGYLESP